MLCLIVNSYSSPGPPRGRRSVPGLGGRENAAATAGDYFRGEAWQAKQRQDEGALGRECQQESGLFAYQGGKFLSLFFSYEFLFF